MRYFITNCVLIVFIQVNIANAEPFEFRDYRQGMSLVQIQRVTEKNGHTLRLNRQEGNYTYITVLSKDGGEIGNLVLCNDSIFSASRLVMGGFERFIKVLDSLTKQGLHKTDVSWRLYLGYDGKEHFSLDVYFFPKEPKADYYVSATLFATEGHGPTNSQITWNAMTEYCK